MHNHQGKNISVEDPDLGQRISSDYIAFMNFGFFVIFFVFNCGFLFMKEDKMFKEKLQNLKI